MKKSIRIIKNILLAFVLVSIGFALGKNFAQRSSKNELPEQIKYTESSSYIEVYYFHSTFRCSTCNKIEKLTKELLQERYSRYVSAKIIIFSEIDFQENENIAEKYGIAASCVVVALKENNKTIEFKRLDKVWTLISKPKEFNNYISQTVNAYLEKIKD